MDDASAVRVRKSIGHLVAVAYDLLCGKRTVRQARAERLTFNQLHRDEDLLIGLANLVDLADVGVIQLGCEPRFANEARAGRVVGHRPEGQDLEGDIPLQPRVPRPVDVARSAGTDGGLNLIRPEARAG